jgi:cytochrome c-type biogenesis protein CcmF
MFALVTHDFRLAYVRDYADRTMSTTYLLTALWGGQEGSLLLWAALQAGLLALLGRSFGQQPKFARLEAVTMGVLSALSAAFCLLVLFHADPFETLGTEATSGVGMNPLLRNPYMAVHPPTLYLGFVGLSVPFAFAVAALAEGGLQELWPKAARSWTLWAWLFLSAGNILGMVWAYEELGWGGYWGWDPVENASFMPWLTGTALLHTLIAQRRDGSHRLWSTFLAALSFVLVVFGTFLTRSGVIQSVHAFAGATSGPYLLALIAGCVLLVLLVGVWRRRDFASGGDVPSSSTRLGMITWTAWLLLLCTVFVWLATTSPLWAEWLRGEKVVMTPEFYNRWMVPLGLCLLGLIGACLVLGWKKLDIPALRRRLLMPLVAAVAAAVIGILGGAVRDVPGPMRYAAVAAMALIAFAAVAVGAELWSSFRKVGSGAAGRVQRLGAHVVHLSVVILFIGFVGAGFEKEDARSLQPGQSLTVGGYTLTFLGLRVDVDFERRALLADIEAKRKGRMLGVFSPGKYTYHSHPGQPTSEVAIRTSLAEDLFLILGDADERTSRASVRVVVNPLVIWLWIGGVLLGLGTILSAWPKGVQKGEESPLRGYRTALWWSIVAAGAVGVGLAFGAHFALLAWLGTCLAAIVVALGRLVLSLERQEEARP